MLIKFGCQITIAAAGDTHTVCLIDPRPELTGAVTNLAFSTNPRLQVATSQDEFGNTTRRFTARPGETTIDFTGLFNTDGGLDPRDAGALIPNIDAIPSSVLGFVSASRYCDSDTLANEAWRLFGNARRDTSLVEKICDFTHERLTFDYGHALSTRTASEAYAERVGVCRDFAHLAIALCRALNIPARYANGYMGDIGVPADPAPMDFNAWFEAYIGGKWYTFDPRHNCRRIGRIVIARGRDACDIPMIRTFGAHKLVSFAVTTELADDLSPLGLVA